MPQQHCSASPCPAPLLPAVLCLLLLSPLQEEAASLWDSLACGGAFGLASAAATTGEVAAVILVKLIMDLYVGAGSRAAFPLTLLMLQVRRAVVGSAAVAYLET